ncbi:MAG: hypothetical protein L0Y42_13840, partial [Phycisphaerales bacterium]|nr:hypothetical protein [Phycisphaerales bacterium]
MLHVLATALIFVQTAATEVSIQMKDGKTIEGVVELESIGMETTFGEATIEFDQIASIQFDAVHVVVTADNTVLKGKVPIAALAVKTESGETSLSIEDVESLVTVRRAKPQAGVVTNGTAANKLTYHLRAPAKYDGIAELPAIVILHGSNMNSKAYMDTIVGQWPAIAERYLLIGINGEYRNADSAADNPAYNYTYVNFVGKSKYKGYPGTDRESPALVAELLQELKARLNLSRVFVGGHSQGGFLTYSVLMNYPELIDGAFPMSSGLIFQCEPRAYEAEEVRAAQRKVPLAIVHGPNDQVVDFGMSRYAYEVFEDDGFAMVKLFADENAGHRFAFLPLEQAISWLEAMSSDDVPGRTMLKYAQQQIEAKDYRSACAVLDRLANQFSDDREGATALEALRAKVNASAQTEGSRLAQLIAENKDGSWVDDFLAFREKFALAKSAKPALEAYAKLREQHQGPADDLFNKARGDFQSGNQDAGYAKYREIVDRYYASSWYRSAKRWLA